jgi:hypothetical protein
MEHVSHYQITQSVTIRSKTSSAPPRDAFSYFGETQMQHHTNACEKIIHIFTQSFKRNKNFDHFAMDGENAFNLGNRMHGLNNIRNLAPELLPFFRDMYGPDSMTDAYFNKYIDGIERIHSKEGCIQGDVLGTFFYSMIIQPMIEKMTNIFQSNDNGFVRFFVDDGNLAGNFDKMCEVLKYVIQEYLFDF